MSSVESTANFRTRIHTMRRRLQDALVIEASATSIDGRTFTYEAPVSEAMPPGSFVAIDAGDTRIYLARILENDIVEREGPEISLDNSSELTRSEDLAGIAIQGVSVRVRLRYARGSGILIGRIDGERSGATGEIDQFDGAAIGPVTSDQLSHFLESHSQGRTALPIGTQAGFDPQIPATMLASGFGRHTFLVGQSGSGKTYSLGVILEQLLLETDLRIIIIDPNSDYVRLRDIREQVAANDPELAARYRDAASGIRVFRPAGRAGSEEETLRIHFSSLTERVQAMVLRIDPLEDREEYDAFRTIVQQMTTETYSLADVEAAARTSLSHASRQVALRIAALNNSGWGIWAEADQPALSNLDGDWRALILDVGGFEQRDEKSLLANAVLQSLWARRNDRQPYLIVIDEAHNICPQEPEDPIQQMVTERAISIAAEGRKFGLYLLLSTQRPSKIHINVLSQCDNLVLMRMNSADDLHQLKHTFSFVPESLFDRSSTFAQGESLIAGKIAPLPLMINFGARVSQEGGSDVADDWTRRS
ncbi:MAG TPA: ATP-binding protein [Thermomicrobiales bacterium]|nr:ATP-binding protein [Thermomicrobiales bacterium]